MRIIIILTFLILTGCSVNPNKGSSPSPAPSKQTLVEDKKAVKTPTLAKSIPVTHWQAKGRLAASKDKEGGNANFTWDQQGDYYQIKLWGPFGSGSVYLIGSPRHVEAREVNGKRTTAKTPEELMQKIAGWQVPLTGLRYWLVGAGHPASKVKGEKLNSEGKPVFFQQDGWQVHYDSYIPTAQGNLPSKLNLQNGNLRVKMIVTDWKKL